MRGITSHFQKMDKMDSIRLENHRITYRGDDIGSLMPFLSHDAESGENFTFGDLWGYVKRDSDILSIVFSGALFDFPLSEYVLESNQYTEYSPKVGEEGMDRLVVSCGTCIDRWSDGMSISIYRDFGGKGLQKAYNNDEELVDGNWGIDFTPVCELLPYPFHIEKNGWVEDDMKSVAEAPISITLFDVLYAIFFEISFYGSPQRRASKLAEIDQSMSEVKGLLKENQ